MSEKDPDQGWQLGCAAGIAILAFFIWVFFFREPDTEWKETVARETERMETEERIRIENARIACDSGSASACVEYGKLIE